VIYAPNSSALETSLEFKLLEVTYPLTLEFSNCQVAGVLCVPVESASYQSYPIGYVQALENHAAMLEQTLSRQFPGSTNDHLNSVRPQLEVRPSSFAASSSRDAFPPNFGFHPDSSPEIERSWWQPPQLPNAVGDQVIAFGSTGLNHPSPPDFAALPAQALSVTSFLGPSPVLRESVMRVEGVDEIPTATAASFFRTYFQYIHPQYPFLDIETCGEWYTEWKLAPGSAPIKGWPAFFVKMVRVLQGYSRASLTLLSDILHWVTHPVKVRQLSKVSTSRPEVSSAKRRLYNQKQQIIAFGSVASYAAFSYACFAFGIYSTDSSYQWCYHEICYHERLSSPY
jgi:hypothetical protein